jgi:tetratricopeptide (TPR) repeat protein
MNPPATPDPTRDERQRILLAMEGYADLGLPDMAWEEYACLSEQDRQRPEVREMELCLHIRVRHWEGAIPLGLTLCETMPGRPAVFIHTAFALHEAGRTPEARALLDSAPAALHGDPLYHYNMACYLAVLGHLREAEPLLRKALQMDGKLRRHARTDPDLKDLRGIL